MGKPAHSRDCTVLKLVQTSQERANTGFTTASPNRQVLLLYLAVSLLNEREDVQAKS